MSMWGRKGSNKDDAYEQRLNSPSPTVSSRKTGSMFRTTGNSSTNNEIQDAMSPKGSVKGIEKSRTGGSRSGYYDFDRGREDGIRKGGGRNEQAETGRQKNHKKRAIEDDSPENSARSAERIPVRERNERTPTETLRVISRVREQQNGAKFQKYNDAEDSDQSSDDGVPVIRRFTYEKASVNRTPNFERIDKEGRLREAQPEEFKRHRDRREESVELSSDSPSPMCQATELGQAVTSTQPKPEKEEMDTDDHVVRDQPPLKKVTVEVFQQPDGTCVVGCLPDENLRAYRSLQNATKDKVNVPLISSPFTVIDPMDLKAESVIPGVKLYRTWQTEYLKMSRMKIDPRTVKPVETLTRYDAIITALSGNVVIKSMQFILTANGKPALKRCNLSEGCEVKISKGSSYSIENWEDTPAMLMMCFIPK